MGTRGHPQEPQVPLGWECCAKPGLGDSMVGEGPPRGPQLPGQGTRCPHTQEALWPQGFIKEKHKPSLSLDSVPGTKGAAREGGAGLHPGVALHAAPCGNPQSSRPLRVCLLEEDTLASLSLCYAVLLPGCPLGHMGHCCRTKGPPLRGQPRLPPHPLVPSSQPTLPTSSAPSCHAWGLEGLEPGLASALIPQSPAEPGSVQCSTEVC